VEPAGDVCIEAGESTVKVFRHQGGGDLVEWFWVNFYYYIVYWIYIFSSIENHLLRSNKVQGLILVSGCLGAFYSTHHWWVCCFATDAVVCEGAPLIFCKWWCLLFRISGDGIIKQQMSANRVSNYTLKKGQIVSVRTRYAFWRKIAERPGKVLLKIIYSFRCFISRMHFLVILIPLKSLN
jgi:hypothetical protein